MTRKNRFRALVGLVFIIAVVIGVLVLPEPKEAGGIFYYYCTIMVRDDEDDQTWEFLAGHPVTFTLDEVPYQELTNQTGGIATVIHDVVIDDWSVSMDSQEHHVVVGPNPKVLDPVVNSYTFYVEPGI